MWMLEKSCENLARSPKSKWYDAIGGQIVCLAVLADMHISTRRVACFFRSCSLVPPGAAVPVNGSCSILMARTNADMTS